MYRNGVVKNRGEYGLLKKEKNIKKNKARLKIEIGRGILFHRTNRFSTNLGDTYRNFLVRIRNSFQERQNRQENEKNGTGIDKKVGGNSLYNNKVCMGKPAQWNIRL